MNSRTLIAGLSGLAFFSLHCVASAHTFSVLASHADCAELADSTCYTGRYIYGNTSSASGWTINWSGGATWDNICPVEPPLYFGHLAAIQGFASWAVDYYWTVEWVPSNPQDVPDPSTSYIVRIDVQERSQVVAMSSASAVDSTSSVSYLRPMFGYLTAYAMYPSPTRVVNPTRPAYQSIASPLFWTIQFSWDSLLNKWIGYVDYQTAPYLTFTGQSPIDPRGTVGGSMSGNCNARIIEIDGVTVSSRF